MKKIIFIILVFAPPFLWAGECDKTYKGYYTWGAEVDIFQPCGQKKAYWVSASSRVKGPLNDFYNKNTTKPYQSIYIEFRGHILDEEVIGFAKEYDGLIRISEIFVQSTTLKGKCTKISHKRLQVTPQRTRRSTSGFR